MSSIFPFKNDPMVLREASLENQEGCLKSKVKRRYGSQIGRRRKVPERISES